MRAADQLIPVEHLPKSATANALPAALGLILALKYAVFGAKDVVGNANRLGEWLSDPRNALHVAVSLLLVVTWLLMAARRTRGLVGLGFGFILVDAVTKMHRMGVYFLNHFLLEAVFAILGLVYVARLAAQEEEEDARRPLSLEK